MLIWVGALAAAFAGLAALVVAGSFNRIDAYAIRHVTAEGTVSLSGEPYEPVSWALLRVYDEGLGWKLQALQVATFPASAVASAFIVAVCCGVLLRRGRFAEALLWGTVWLSANVLDYIAKNTLERPALYGEEGALRLHIVPFDSSFPSGNAARCVIVAVVIAQVWPRSKWVLYTWAVLVLPFRVITGTHTVSDVLGGLLLGLALVHVGYACLQTPRLMDPLQRASESALSRVGIRRPQPSAGS